MTPHLILPILGLGLLAVFAGWVSFRLWRRGFRRATLGAAALCVAGAVALALHGLGQPGWQAGLMEFLIALGIGFGPGLGLVGGIVVAAAMNRWRVRADEPQS